MKARSYKGYLAEGDTGYVRRCIRESLRAKKLLLRRVDALLEAAVLLPVCMADPDKRTENIEEIYVLLEGILNSFEQHGIRVSLPPLLEMQMPERRTGKNTVRRAERKRKNAVKKPRGEKVKTEWAASLFGGQPSLYFA